MGGVPQSKVIIGEALTELRNLGPESVQCCVTSPPYWGLRDYGVSNQLGLEKTPEEYVAKMVEIFREARRVLRKDGTLWLNLGDSYMGSGQDSGKQEGTQSQSIAGGRKVGVAPYIKPPTSQKHDTLKPKDLCGIPWRVAFALQQDGWWLRQDIIWHKPNPMPESVTDRCTKSHEYIFLLSKSAKYYYDADAISQPAAESTIGRGAVDFGGAKGRAYNPEKDDPNYRAGSEQWGRTYEYKNGNVNKRSVWTINTKPYPEAHFAVFPDEIPANCIKAGSKEGDVVLDPFLGSGTTAQTAKKLGRKYIGIELNPEYLPLINRRLAQEELFGA